MSSAKTVTFHKKIGKTFFLLQIVAINVFDFKTAISLLA